MPKYWHLRKVNLNVTDNLFQKKNTCEIVLVTGKIRIILPKLSHGVKLSPVNQKEGNKNQYQNYSKISNRKLFILASGKKKGSSVKKGMQR